MMWSWIYPMNISLCKLQQIQRVITLVEVTTCGPLRKKFTMIFCLY